MTDTHAQSAKKGRRAIVSVLRAVGILMLAAVFLGIGCLTYVRFGLSGENAARVLARIVESGTGAQLTFSSARLSWSGWDTAVFELHSARLDVPRARNYPVQSKRVVLEAGLRSVPGGMLRLRRMIIDRPVLYLPPRSDVPPSQDRTGEMGSFERSLLGRIRIDRLAMQGGTVTVGRTERGDRFQGTILSGLNLDARDVNIRAVRSFLLTADVSGGESKGRVIFRGSADSVPIFGSRWKGAIEASASNLPVVALRIIGDYLELNLPLIEGSIGFEGRAKAGSSDTVVEGQLRIANVYSVGSDLFAAPLQLPEARAEFSANLSEESTKVDLSELFVPGINLSGGITLTRSPQNERLAAIHISYADADLARVFPFVPVKLLSDSDRKRLAKAGLKGRITVYRGAWSGKLQDLLREEGFFRGLQVDARFEKASGIVPRWDMAVSDASGRVHVDSSKLLLESCSLTVGNSPILISGNVSRLQTTPVADLFVSVDARAKDIEPVLQSRSLGRYLPWWLDMVEEPEGSLSSRLDIKGSRDNLKLSGDLTMDGFSCRLRDFPLPVRDMKGKLSLRGKRITVEHISALLGRSKIRVEGRISNDDTTAVKGDGSFHPYDLRILAKIPRTARLQGTVPVSWSVERENGDTTFRARSHLTDNTVQISHWVRKKQGVPLSLEIWGRTVGNMTRIEEGYITTRESRIAVKGELDSSKNLTLQVNLPPKGIQTKDLTHIAHPDLDIRPGGRIEGDLIVKTGLSTGREASVTGDLSLTHVGLRLWGFHKPFSGITGTLGVRGLTLKGHLDRAKLGNTIFSGDVTVNRGPSPNVKTDLTCQFFDSDDFASPPGEANVQTWSEWINTNPVIRFLARSEGQAHITVKQGLLAGRKFTDFKARLSGHDGILNITDWTATAFGGGLRGKARINIRAGNKVPLNIDLFGDHLRMSRILLADPEHVSIVGDVLINGNIQWNTASTRENGGVYRTGTAEVRVRKGVIHRFEILSKIFSFINLGSFLRGRLPDFTSQGLPFDLLVWSMSVFDDKWKVTDLKLYSDAARIQSEGMYFERQARVDFTVDVSPLVGIDTIFKGLFGNMLTKNGKLLTTRFRVRGLYYSPDVRLMPLESLAGP